LLSGDGDFELLIRHIKNKHQVSTQAFGVEQLTANALINAVDSFTAIDDNLLQ
tara:strand:- start:350 stop:508 length:159 start_codon:yes stop_codon:yes gene_type:complete